jgi:hypothetical protein
VQRSFDIQEYTDPEHDPMIPHTLDASALLLETSYEELQEVESKLRHQNLLTGVRDTDTWKAVLAGSLLRDSCGKQIGTPALQCRVACDGRLPLCVRE